MSVLTTSVPAWRAQGLFLLSIVFGVLAVASGYTATTLSLTGFDYHVALASLIAIEVGAIIGVSLAAKAAMDKNVWAALAAGAIGAICVGNALANGVTFAWSKHVAQQTQRLDKSVQFAGQRELLLERVAGLQEQLVPYDKIRTGEEILKDLRACEESPCRNARVEKLRSEQTKAGERDGVARSLAQAEAALAASVAPPPAGTPLALFLEKFWGAAQDKVELGAAVLYVLLLQCVGPLFAALSGLHATRDTTASDVALSSKQALLVTDDGAPSVSVTEPVSLEVRDVFSEEDTEGDTEGDTDGDRDSGSPNGGAERRALERLVGHINERLRVSGGETLVTHRGLSREHQVSTGTVGKALKRVELDGVRVISSPRGTRLLARQAA